MSKVSQAVIMVGGKGTRLRPLTDNIPKPILPVLDRPCLSYLLRSMAEGGIDHVILACGYRSEQMAAAIGSGSEYGMDIEYSYEDTPMGTAGAVKILEDRLDETFVAANGDVFAYLDVKSAICTHIRNNAAVTISLTEVDDPCEFGIARIDGSGRITEFKEKPKPEEVFSNLINAGLYVVDRDVLKYVPEGLHYDLSKELVPDLLSRKYVIQGHPIDGLWIDVGRPSDLIRANNAMAEKIHGRRSFGGVTVEGAFHAGDGVTIRSSDLRDCVISKGSTVTNSKITNSLILDGCRIEDCAIADSVIGRDCVLRFSEIGGEVVADGSVIERTEGKVPR